MTARVLVVDDLAANIKLLEARLAAEYFEVVTATNGPQALEICARGPVRHRPARRDDAGHGRARGLPAAEEQSAHRPHPRGHHHRARPAVGPDRGPGGGRRRFPHQAGQRHRADHPGQEPGAAEDADRRADDARGDLVRDRPRRRARSDQSGRGGRQGAAGRGCAGDGRTHPPDPGAADPGRSRDRPAGSAVPRRRGRLRPRHHQSRPQAGRRPPARARTCARSTARGRCRS